MPAPRYDAMGRDALIGRIPPVRGTLTPDAQIARFTWFRVGGPAEILFEPADSEDLASFLTALSDDIPVTIIGVGSNLLVRDGGIPGITIRLGRAFAGIAIENDIVTAAGGAVDVTVSRAARDAGRGGLEFLSGIPGTIGGAIRMNAGAYGREIQDVLIDGDRGRPSGSTPRRTSGLIRIQLSSQRSAAGLDFPVSPAAGRSQ